MALIVAIAASCSGVGQSPNDSPRAEVSVASSAAPSASSDANPSTTIAPLPQLSDPEDALIGTLTVGSRPCALEVTDDGRVFATLSPSGTIVQLDPETGERTVTAMTDSQACGLAWAGGHLWVATLSTQLLHRIDPASAATISSLELAGPPWDVQPGGGRVWVADRGLPGVVSFDAKTAERGPAVEFEGPPSGIAYVDGRLWVAFEGLGTVARLNEAGDAVDLTVDVGGAPAWFGDSDGVLWVTDSRNGTITQIEPDSGEISEVVMVDGSPLDPVGIEGELWVPIGSTGELLRIAQDGTVLGRLMLGTGVYVAEAVDDEVWVENFSGTEIYRVDPAAVGP